MSDLLIDIVDHLARKNLVVGDGKDAFRDFMPDKPDQVTTVYEYQGSPTPLQEQAVHRSLQIVVRDSSASKAKQKCYSIFKELSPLNRHMILETGRWCQLYPRQSPFKLKTDDSGRAYYCFNLGVTTNRD